MTTAWSHLPNAAHIDRILAAITDNPGNWDWDWHRVSNRAGSAAWDAALDVVYSAARDVARSAVLVAVFDAALDAAWHQARDAALDAARSAILALIAWDETSDYLDLPVEQVRVLAALGDHKAVLILPAAIAFESQKEIT
jgi:hypothetical protein